MNDKAVLFKSNESTDGGNRSTNENMTVTTTVGNDSEMNGTKIYT